MALDQRQDLEAQVEVIGALSAWCHAAPFAPDRTLDPGAVADSALLMCQALLREKPDRGAAFLRAVGEYVAGQLAELREGQQPDGSRA